MKKITALKTIIVQVVLVILFAACGGETVLTLEQAEKELISNTVSAANVVQPIVEAETPVTIAASCAAPTVENLADCQEIEADILSVTVRIELRIYKSDRDGNYVYEDGSVGHATVVAGRYLLTHNHYSLSLDDIQDDRQRTISIYRPNGEIIMKDAPFSSFTVVETTSETLLFDFGQFGDSGLFAALGLQSANFDSNKTSELQAGMVVGQINWDGEIAFVDWVNVIAIEVESGVQIIVLDNFVEQGASGGGVFWDGHHLANNWFRGTEKTTDGEILQQYSVAALNADAQ